MINLGNTCYFNSIIQCLIRVPHFSGLKPATECEITDEFFAWVNHERTDPTRLLELFRFRFEHFARNEQHDSQEVYMCLLYILEKSLTNFITDLFYGKETQ